MLLKASGLLTSDNHTVHTTAIDQLSSRKQMLLPKVCIVDSACVEGLPMVLQFHLAQPTLSDATLPPVADCNIPAFLPPLLEGMCISSEQLEYHIIFR
jgi:hypothetical protein